MLVLLLLEVVVSCIEKNKDRCFWICGFIAFWVYGLICIFWI